MRKTRIDNRCLNKAKLNRGLYTENENSGVKPPAKKNPVAFEFVTRCFFLLG